MDVKEKEALRNQITDLRDEVKGLRGNIGEWRSDEYRILGEGMKQLADLGREVLKEAPASKAAQQIYKTMTLTPSGQEIPLETRASVIDQLRPQGLVVRE